MINLINKDSEIVLRLSVDKVNTILYGLLELQAKIANPIIQEVQEQVKPQLDTLAKETKQEQECSSQ